VEKPEKKDTHPFKRKFEYEMGYNEGLQAGLAYHDAKTLEERKKMADIAAECQQEAEERVLKVTKAEYDAKIKPIKEALEGILEIGKRDMSNPKYDIYFEEAKQAIRNLAEGSK